MPTYVHFKNDIDLILFLKLQHAQKTEEQLR